MENLRIRPATPDEAAELLRIRYEAIIAVRVVGVPADRVRHWAERRDIGWMERAVRDRETWVGTVNDEIMSWIAVKGDSVEGLYTDPRVAGHGIGSALLRFVEGVLCSRGATHIHLEASGNAEGFYRRHGYEAVGPCSTDGAQAMLKVVRKA